VSEVARRHEISSQHLFAWRKAPRRGQLALPADEAGVFVPVMMAAHGCDGALDHDRDGWDRGSGRMRRGCRVARGCTAHDEGPVMIVPSGAVRVLMATRPADFRKGMDGLAALVCESLRSDPHSGVICVFRAKRAADRQAAAAAPDRRVGAPRPNV
jgi:hypothetical protein